MIVFVGLFLTPCMIARTQGEENESYLPSYFLYKQTQYFIHSPDPAGIELN